MTGGQSHGRDIPGITAEEINALETLKTRKRSDGDRDYFNYGMMAIRQKP